jgi:hypothetical protein
MNEKVEEPKCLNADWLLWGLTEETNTHECYIRFVMEFEEGGKKKRCCIYLHSLQNLLTLQRLLRDYFKIREKQDDERRWD